MRKSSTVEGSKAVGWNVFACCWEVVEDEDGDEDEAGEEVVLDDFRPVNVSQNDMIYSSKSVDPTSNRPAANSPAQYYRVTNEVEGRIVWIQQGRRYKFERGSCTRLPDCQIIFPQRLVP